MNTQSRSRQGPESKRPRKLFVSLLHRRRQPPVPANKTFQLPPPAIPLPPPSPPPSPFTPLLPYAKLPVVSSDAETDENPYDRVNRLLPLAELCHSSPMSTETKELYSARRTQSPQFLQKRPSPLRAPRNCADDRTLFSRLHSTVKSMQDRRDWHPSSRNRQSRWFRLWSKIRQSVPAAIYAFLHLLGKHPMTYVLSILTFVVVAIAVLLFIIIPPPFNGWIGNLGPNPVLQWIGSHLWKPLWEHAYIQALLHHLPSTHEQK